MKRKAFLQYGGAGVLGMCLPNVAMASTIDPLDPNLVKEFVAVGHNNLPRVKEMLMEYPNLIYARHDGGNGDFEEAIEGAGHVGDREIAEYLISQGARVNLFVLTMLGETQLVKPVIEKYPQLLYAKGAHGFTLLHHAIRGEEPAAEMLEYLKSKGLTETQIKIK